MKTLKLLCECSSFDCKLSIEVPFEEALKARAYRNNIIIIDGCQAGSDPGETLVRKENGYSIFRD